MQKRVLFLKELNRKWVDHVNFMLWYDFQPYL